LSHVKPVARQAADRLAAPFEGAGGARIGAGSSGVRPPLGLVDLDVAARALGLLERKPDWLLDRMVSEGLTRAPKSGHALHARAKGREEGVR
jgi:hypothetical protein